MDDYTKVTYGMRDTLQLIRKGDDDSLFRTAAAGVGKVVLSELAWSVPVVQPNDVRKVNLYKSIASNNVSFRMRQSRVIQSDRLVSCIIRGVVSKLITTTLGNRSRIIANGSSPISVIVQSQSYVKLLNLHSLIYTLASSNQKIKSKRRRAMEISKTVVQIFRFYPRDTR